MAYSGGRGRRRCGARPAEMQNGYCHRPAAAALRRPRRRRRLRPSRWSPRIGRRRTRSRSPAAGSAGLCRPRHYAPQQQENRERYAGEAVAAVRSVADTPVSTFSIDVDTGVLRQRPPLPEPGPAAARRTRCGSRRCSTTSATTIRRPPTRDGRSRSTPRSPRRPWNPETPAAARSACAATIVPRRAAARRTSSSWSTSRARWTSPTSCRWSRRRCALLADQLGENDRVAIVVYAGAAGPRARRRPRDRKATILAALDQPPGRRLDQRRRRASSSPTTSRARNFIEGGINRVILATDGDFNVGVTDNQALDQPDRARARRRHHPDRARLRQGNQGRDDGADRRQRQRQLRLHRLARARRRRCSSSEIGLDAVHDRQGREDPGRVQPGLWSANTA